MTPAITSDPPVHEFVPADPRLVEDRGQRFGLQHHAGMDGNYHPARVRPVTQNHVAAALTDWPPPSMNQSTQRLLAGDSRNTGHATGDSMWATRWYPPHRWSSPGPAFGSGLIRPLRYPVEGAPRPRPIEMQRGTRPHWDAWWLDSGVKGRW